MQSQRLTRINELLRREIAALLFREMTETGFDLAAVTITRAEISSNLRHARISVSVRGDDETVRRVFSLLQLHRPAIQKQLRDHVILKYTPILHFERDESLSEGDRILQILDHLPPPAADEETGTPES
jgi:ribosome-binding factor A